MNTPDIIAEAKKRLAECEAEADKLRRMIAAAEGTHVAPPYPRDFPWTLEGDRGILSGTIPIMSDPNMRYGSFPSLGSSIVGDLVTTTGIRITGSTPAIKPDPSGCIWQIDPLGTQCSGTSS